MMSVYCVVLNVSENEIHSQLFWYFYTRFANFALLIIYILYLTFLDEIYTGWLKKSKPQSKPQSKPNCWPILKVNYVLFYIDFLCL